MSESWKNFEEKTGKCLKSIRETVHTCPVAFQDVMREGLKKCEENFIGE